jgi:acetyl esterase
MAGLLDRIRRAGRKPFHAMTPEEARAAYVAGAEVLEPPRRPLARVQDLVLPGGDGGRCRARLYAPSTERLPAMLYLHGGGFVVGGLETHDALCRQLAARSGCAVIALDYRLAPEHPFPAAQDDTWAALRALPGMAEALGIDATRLAVGGDSAGGTLAAVAALMARDAGLPLALQLLITPGTGAHADTASHRLFGNGFLIDAATIAWFFDHTSRITTGATGALRHWKRPIWTASRPPACCWPSATRWSTKASPTPTDCAWPVCRCSWSWPAA